ncbi:hypothetical protein [Sphingobacterium siyangense]|uniref:hypothetical protein n=1 Tax=Sphingobacterium siyangense TaxID=459529 RepID=UPI003017A1E6
MTEEKCHDPNKLVKIILKSSDHAIDFANDNLIHRKEFDTTIEHIEHALKIAVESPTKQYLHNTITLLGTRGSGKTSFLLSIKKRIEEAINTNSSTVQLSKAIVLEIIDPTLIEEKGHVFLNVISLIKDLVENQLDHNECSPSSIGSSPINRKTWRSSLSKLAAGLPSIDGIGSRDVEDWQDPEFVMENGLKAVSASQKLLENFNKFIDLSLKILSRQAFILIFDDIDVDSSKGWVVLETIRKYFTGSKLITILSGDLELYTIVVRQQKWKHFGEEIIKYEGKDNLEEFRSQVTKLTAQYMLKIMQPQYRIHLNNLLYRKNTNKGLGLEVAVDSNSPSSKLEDLYIKILNNYGVHNKVQSEVFITFLLSQPVRSQIQFLIAFQDIIIGNTEDALDNNKVSDIFLSNLLDQKIDVLDSVSTPKYLVSVILKFLLSKNKLEDLYQLQPSTTDENTNAALFSLSLILSNSIKTGNRFLIIDYMIKIGFIRNLIPILPYEITNVHSNNLRPTIDDLCRRTGVFHDIVLRDLMGKIQSYLLGALEFESTIQDVTPYFIQLKALESVSKKGEKNRIDEIFNGENINKASRILAFIPSYIASYSYKNQSRTCFSLYMVLSSIGEVVKQYDSVLKYLEESEKTRLLKQLLSEVSQIRSYPIVGFGEKQIDKSSPKNSNEIAFTNIKESSSDTTDDLLVNAILVWLSSDLKFAPASYMLGKILTRFFFAMNNIAEESSKDISLDVLIHRQVISLMNAILIEDTRENLNGMAFKLNINNTNTDDKIFIENLKKINDNEDSLSERLVLSRWILSCPLLVAYLKSDSNEDLFSALDSFLNTEYCKTELLSFNLNSLLREVALRSQGGDLDEYNMVSGKPEMLSNISSVVDALKENDIPFDWFEKTDDRAKIINSNKQIKKYISSIFSSTNKITKFREGLSKEGIKW